MGRIVKTKNPRGSVSPASSTVTKDVSLGPLMPDPSEVNPQRQVKSLPRRTSRRPSDEATSLEISMANVLDEMSDDDHDVLGKRVTQPQHLDGMKYYRVAYRGVVSLLSGPNESSARSGGYVSYGEIIGSASEFYSDCTRPPCPSTPPRQVKETTSIEPPGQSDIAKRKIIRVDLVLTGGYTVDAMDSAVEASDKTPRRGNTHSNVSVVGLSPLPLAANRSLDHQTHEQQTLPHGYLFETKKQIPILVPILSPPLCERGEFLYKVTSSTPLAVYTGPSLDAPKTKVMLVPGTVHEVCLRVLESSVCFLRLTRRRGWVADRRTFANNAQESTEIIVMREVADRDCDSECNSSMASTVGAKSVSTPVPMSQRRHRPPRRHRTTSKPNVDSAPLPRQIPGLTHQNLSQSRNESYDYDSQVNQSQDRGIMSPSSNISLLSDESSLEASTTNRHPGVMTPDRSVAPSTISSYGASARVPSFFLMRVNAPRGLKILDAPHFQVNNLIHGSHPSVGASPSRDSVKSGNQSIFQTMSGHHTTTLTSKIVNPAVFDSVTKARKLPRGSLFEASKRVESPGAFSQGAGLIKLSDNSGWAIIPKREELDEQYRNYSGSLNGIKEGEASRAAEEVGNAIIDDHHSPIYIRILTRNGITVSLPPSSTIPDDETSPTSSVGGSSSVASANNSSGIIRCHDSDVASSVGSSFLDAMFRTPKRRERDLPTNENRRDLGNPAAPKVSESEKLPFSTLLPCGSFVEVDRWITPAEPDRAVYKAEYARLRGGQGWIPRSLNGKPITEIISAPETRFGSFWFRVQDRNGIKVRLGPSRRAPSIKSDDGVFFRFECGEFLRASEVVTFFRQNAPSECYAKLYRNRHVRLYAGHGEIRPLSSLTVQAEWVEVFGQQELFLEECGVEPRIERHQQGWRYNVVLDARVQVRKGPSLDAECNGVVLLGGESVLINERVTGPDDTITWLRLKDGQGWVHNVDTDGETLMIPHSLRHRKGPPGPPTKSGKPEQEEVPYNTIIARLFHNDLHDENNSKISQARNKRRWT